MNVGWCSRVDNRECMCFSPRQSHMYPVCVHPLHTPYCTHPPVQITHREAWAALQSDMGTLQSDMGTPGPNTTTPVAADAHVQHILGSLDQRELAAGAGGRFWLQVRLGLATYAATYTATYRSTRTPLHMHSNPTHHTQQSNTPHTPTQHTTGATPCAAPCAASPPTQT